MFGVFMVKIIFFSNKKKKSYCLKAVMVFSRFSAAPVEKKNQTISISCLTLVLLNKNLLCFFANYHIYHKKRLSESCCKESRLTCIFVQFHQDLNPCPAEPRFTLPLQTV